MRGVRIATIALGLFVAVPVRAGVYNPAAPDAEWQTREKEDFRVFRDLVRLPLRQFGTPEGKTALHHHYALIATLTPHLASGKLSLDDRVSLSAYLIRMHKFQEAVNLLIAAQRQSGTRGNFLFYSNLATAEALNSQVTGSPDLAQRATDYLGDALQMWPREWGKLTRERREALERMGWAEQTFLWYRRADTYLLKLLRLRTREARLTAGKMTPLGTAVEPLFDEGTPGKPVQWVGDSGKYEAGKLAVAEQKKLPADAIRIVQQLLIWMPDDLRLYWLLGELYNARGEYATAYAIFEEIGRGLQTAGKKGGDLFGKVDSTKKGGVQPLPQIPFGENRNFPELPEPHRAHWLVIRDAKEKAEKEALQGGPEPKEGVAPPPPPQPGAKNKDKQPASSGDSFPIDLRSLGVGFGAGVLVAIFGYWQLREVRRRRGARATAPPAGDSGPHWAGPKDAITARPPEGKPR